MYCSCIKERILCSYIEIKKFHNHAKIPTGIQYYYIAKITHLRVVSLFVYIYIYIQIS